MRFRIKHTKLEGGNIATSTNIILFDKYRVTKVIYQSEQVTVYEVWHMYMSAKRVIKKILKKSIRQDSFYSEVKILKNLRHPGIPIIYDVIEDSFAYYIIEEYIEGETLEEYVGRYGPLSEEKVLDIGIKICRIVLYLHCQKPIPVLFLDIHPKNILINQDEIFLVDFGNSYYQDETAVNMWHMGTAGYAAPEQYIEGSLDGRADIFGIGAVLGFLMVGRNYKSDQLSLQIPQNISEKMKMIVTQCMARDREHRFQSVESLLANLMELTKGDNVCLNNEKPYIISFVGAIKRIGVTHISLGFAYYLAAKGYKVVYEEANDSNHTRLMAKYEKLKYDSGFFSAGKLLLKPAYGPQIQLDIKCDYIIRDEGVYGEDMDKMSYPVLIVGGKSWEFDNAIAICSKEDWKLILSNGADSTSTGRLCGQLNKAAMPVPFLDEPLKRSDINKAFYERLEKCLKINRNGGDIDKKKAWFFKRIRRKS